MIEILISILGIFAYFVMAHIVINRLLKWMYEYIGRRREANRLTSALGNIERLIYVICFLVKAHVFIGVWFATKIVSNMVIHSKIGKNNRKEEGERRNVYLIGNVGSLTFGILGGILIRVILERWFPDLLNWIRGILSQ